MNNLFSSVECWVGVDWSDDSHAVFVVDTQGKKVAAFQVEHTREGLQELVTRLRAAGSLLGVGVETTHGVMIYQLLEAGFPVFPVNPKLSHAWREGWKVSAPKSDPGDAEILANGLKEHHERLHPLQPDDPVTRELAMLCTDECRLIRERTALVNRLEATLKEYYPQALEWFSDWTGPSAWDFVLTFPAPESLRLASRKKVLGFLKTHCIGLSSLWQQRVESQKASSPWPSDPATEKAKSLLAVSLAKSRRVGTYFAVQPEYVSGADRKAFWRPS